jgi:hypothetical protein
LPAILPLLVSANASLLTRFSATAQLLPADASAEAGERRASIGAFVCVVKIIGIFRSFALHEMREHRCVETFRAITARDAPLRRPSLLESSKIKSPLALVLQS